MVAEACGVKMGALGERRLLAAREAAALVERRVRAAGGGLGVDGAVS